jgi:hypothetical protein
LIKNQQITLSSDEATGEIMLRVASRE